MVIRSTQKTCRTNTAVNAKARRAPDILEKSPSFDNGLIPPLGPIARLSKRYHTNKIYTPHPGLQQLLVQPGSLTKALENTLGSRICANIHHQKPHKLSTAWRTQLQPIKHSAWQVRTTSLYSQDIHKLSNHEPLVFAQTLIPQASLKQLDSMLKNMIQQPIGHWLFSQKSRPVRYWLYIGKVNTACLPQSLKKYYLNPKDELKCGDVWIRQSILRVGINPFVITEIMLPALIKALNPTNNTLAASMAVTRIQPHLKQGKLTSLVL